MKRSKALLAVASVVLVAACASAGIGQPSSTSGSSGSSAIATASASTLAASLTPSPSTTTPTASLDTAIPLHADCSSSSPCALTAGTWVTAGEYSFIPGLHITVPDGWESQEQNLGEFSLDPLDHPNDRIFLWKDVAAITSDGSARLVPGVPRTPIGLTAYFRGDRDFVVSAQATATIAGGIRTLTYVVGVSPSAKYTNHECPAYPHCADLLKDPAHWSSESYGIGAPEVVRLYLATIGSGGDTHLLVIALDAPSAKELERLTKVAAPIIASIRLPPVIGSQ